jgi:hypothetical protein
MSTVGRLQPLVKLKFTYFQKPLSSWQQTFINREFQPVKGLQTARSGTRLLHLLSLNTSFLIQWW